MRKKYSQALTGCEAVFLSILFGSGAMVLIVLFVRHWLGGE